MKKYLLMLSISLLAVGTANALTPEEQLGAMKEIFLKEFNVMDKNKDGSISQAEYLSYQFDSFRSHMIEATSFDSLSTVPDTTTDKEKTESKAEVELGGVSPALKEMAEFDIDLDDDLKLDLENNDTSSDIASSEIDLTLSEDENLKNLLAEMTEKEKAETEGTKEEEAVEEVNPEEREKQLGFMMETIKKSLPKKIDEITSWIDIEYANNTIAYIYQADIDTAKFSDKDKKALEDNIKNEACQKAYSDMCPKVKTMFIDEGINMQIRYYDKNNTALSSCEFNKETCK